MADNGTTLFRGRNTFPFTVTPSQGFSGGISPRFSSLAFSGFPEHADNQSVRLRYRSFPYEDTSTAIITVNVTDTVNLSESLSAIGITTSTVSDSLTLSENLNATATFTVNISDSLAIAENYSSVLGSSVTVGESISISESIENIANFLAFVPETLSLSESMVPTGQFTVPFVISHFFQENLEKIAIFEVSVSEALSITDTVDIFSAGASVLSPTEVRVFFSSFVRESRALSLSSYNIRPANPLTAVRVALLTVKPVRSLLGSGEAIPLGSSNLTTDVLDLQVPGASPGESLIINGFGTVILTVFGGTFVTVDRFFPVGFPLPWERYSPIYGVDLTFSEPTGDQNYIVSVKNLFRLDGRSYNQTSTFESQAENPTLLSVTYLQEYGDILCTFSEPMSAIALSPQEFTLSGGASVRSARWVTENQILLSTVGIHTAGVYTLTLPVSLYDKSLNIVVPPP